MKVLGRKLLEGYSNQLVKMFVLLTSTRTLSSDPDELCYRLKLLLGDEQARNNSKVSTEKRLL